MTYMLHAYIHPPIHSVRPSVRPSVRASVYAYSLGAMGFMGIKPNAAPGVAMACVWLPRFSSFSITQLPLFVQVNVIWKEHDG
jgi:hypothetical protein